MAKTISAASERPIVYEIYPPSWQSISAMTRHLFIPSLLGADYVWFAPLYPSPQQDHGYDISDHMAIDPRFGSLRDFEFMVEIIHNYGMSVIMDLVLNHTSTAHRWFKTRPDFYCWSKQIRPGWKNLFSNGSAWSYDMDRQQFYLRLFQETQADLNWFPDGHINQELVEEFRRFVRFWRNLGVDGFRLDVPQSINKNFESETLEFSDLLIGDKAKKVLNAVFSDKQDDLFLMMELFDPTFGDITRDYTDNTPVDFVLNVLVKDEISKGTAALQQAIKSSVENPHFMLDLESHDSPRFPSRGVTPEQELELLFSSGANGICIYQGQELGLTNPTPRELPDCQLLALDAQTSMRHHRGESLRNLRPLSRANARVPLSMDECMRQLTMPESYFNLTRGWIRRWKNS